MSVPCALYLNGVVEEARLRYEAARQACAEAKAAYARAICRGDVTDTLEAGATYRETSELEDLTRLAYEAARRVMRDRQSRVA